MNTLKSLTIRYLAVWMVLFIVVKSQLPAAEPPPYAAYFDPQRGFKPAQANFTKIFLQLAGSLEFYGSPEPYIDHVMSEHARIAAKYEAAKGKKGTARPDYLTDEYLENLLTNWNKLTPGLKLDDLCRQSGKNLRYAILGSWNAPIDEALAQEAALTPEERAAFRKLLEKPFFTKSDFPAIDAFYKTGFDKLSEEGKQRISTRTWRGTLAPAKRAEMIEDDKGGSMAMAVLNEHQTKFEHYLNSDSQEVVNAGMLEAAIVTRLKLDEPVVTWQSLPEVERDAFKHSQAIKLAFTKRVDHVEKNSVSPEDAKNITATLRSMYRNLLVIAHSEYLAAVKELSIR